MLRSLSKSTVTISAKTVAQRVRQVSGVTFMSVQVIESAIIYIDTGQYNKSKPRSKSIRKGD
jgi:hypothetical protein